MQRECPLSRRELSIVHLMSLGMTAKEIARETATSPNTVSSHIVTAKLKAGGKMTATGLVATALREGWIQ
ncbi:response regulator transcription factor [Sinorhizobium meliloti]|uniref:response regulator transcription factor n=1 Tax=Rhizobium meliloti TaxID=382 RepID=UPI000B5A8B98|nr:LuxR C-terminal-related transcriptional regulator [Sinorhizobium meliloti]ASJ58976.1 hypothetical protein SMB554_07095 [Sinorhizobium meliloti]MCK3783496.1 response regulator transcription factor [Sinorhizobium meliloti]MCK3787874.1 response regulator transcription factor [Sinorhizobium meliloti]MCK3794849.1 response regulator transcription factor [Sinorhizobium meliloti]UTG98617.1 response regulator transcription factor [Sinorhizobium meliloti]